MAGGLRSAASFAGLLLALGTPNGLAAQQLAPDQLRQGQDVRYRLRERPRRSSRYLAGSFVRLSDSRLRITERDSGAQRSVPVAAIRELQVARGTRGHRAAGLAVGGAVGCGVGLALANDSGTEDPQIDRALGCVLGGGLGLLVGSTVGGAIRSPRWLSVNLDGASSSGSAGLSLRLSLAIGPS